ncbi:hypothetical protein HNR23_000671 [Nocardiopsis mwathae]|uniref:Uncharacterized protein n=1 Tax=Nocardiopsis mwathae TaxID=1472723 RepID=A0A7W9YFN2_9ACTN|nr:hypothetical protein [Nocardiopsis mwathae]
MSGTAPPNRRALPDGNPAAIGYTPGGALGDGAPGLDGQAGPCA